jgi:hypothetical protein
MELPVTRHTTDGDMRLRADVPQRVIIAFDQLTEGEKSAVLAALHTLARDGLQTPSGTPAITRLAGPEPLYSLCAAPEVRVIVRAEPGAPIDVVDIVRPAALRHVAHAAG